MLTSKWTLLLIEPDSGDAALAARILSQELEGCRICVANDAVSYAKYFAEDDFSAVISELDLGWGSGVDILTSFGQRMPGTRLILFAWKLPPDIERLSKEIGLTGYAKKGGAGFLNLPDLVRTAPENEPLRDGGEILWSRAVEELEEPALTALKDGRILEANPLAARVFGYGKPDDLLGLQLAALFTDSGESLSGKEDFSRQLQGLGLSDAERLEVMATPAKDPLGVGRRRLVGWPIPYSPRVALVYHALPHANMGTSMGNGNSRQQPYTELLYAVSHDLQEPLQLICRHTKLLQDTYAKQLDESGARFIDNLVSNSSKMQSMLDDLLEFSRLGRIAPGMHEVDLNALLIDVVEVFRSRLAEIDGKVQWQGLPRILADRGQMVRLFQNLIGNAIKFHSDDPLVVEIEALVKDEYLELVVKDNGIGIDPSKTEAIFGMFKRLHTQEEYPGNGMGLAICRRIVSLHGGEIWARPRKSPDRGTALHFTLARTLSSSDSGIGAARESDG